MIINCGINTPKIAHVGKVYCCNDGCHDPAVLFALKPPSSLAVFFFDHQFFCVT